MGQVGCGIIVWIPPIHHYRIIQLSLASRNGRELPELPELPGETDQEPVAAHGGNACGTLLYL